MKTKIKIKITAKCRASRCLRFERLGIMPPEMRPESFGSFEKQAPDLRVLDGFCAKDRGIPSFNTYLYADHVIRL